MSNRTRRSDEPRIRVDLGPGHAARAPDHWRINVDEEWSMRFWMRELGCRDEVLRHAVRMAGDNAGAVRDYLRAG